jgi:F0F1-type ATP synthase membrane subunit b/b'
VRVVSEGISIFELLDRLEELMESAAKIPFSSKVILDQDEVLDILDRLRAELPEEYQKAQEVLAKREAVLLDARRQAADILGDARNQVARMVDESEISRIARQEREAILSEADETAADIVNSANKYAQSVLASLETSLRRVLDAVVKGQSELNESIRQAASSGEDDDADESEVDD